MSRPAFTPRQAAALGVLFAAEMLAAGNPNLPATRKMSPALARPLVARGLIVEESEDIPAFAGLSMTVTGYRLTPAGHRAYCAWAADQPVREDEP